MKTKYKTFHILTGFTFLTAIAIIISFVVSFSIYKQASVESTKQELFNTAELMIPAVTEKIKSQISPDFFIKTSCKKGPTRLTIIDNTGKVIADSEKDITLLANHGDRAEIIVAKREKTGYSTRYSETLKRVLIYTAIKFKTEKNDYFIRASMPLKTFRTFVYSYISNFIIAGVLIIFTSLALSIFLTRKISAPLNIMTKTAEKYSQGDFKDKTYIDNPIEFKILADALNKMSENIESKIMQITRSKEEFESIFNNMNDSVIVFDRNLTVSKFNVSAVKLFKLKTEHIKEKSLISIFEDSTLSDIGRKILKEGGKTTLHTVKKYKNSANKTFKIQITRFGLGESNEPENTSLLLVISDITKIKKLQSIRKEFVSNVSHELKTPVTSITGYLETLIDMPLEDTATVKKFLNTAHRNSMRLTEIINDILTLAQLEENTLTVENTDKTTIKSVLNSIKTQTLELSITNKEPIITIDCPESLDWNLNTKFISHALLNLTTNGIKYNNSLQPELKLEAYTEDNKLIIKVSDNGVGIPEEYKNRIFERFFRIDKGRTRDTGGSGLGLAIVKHIIKAHKGHIEVSSNQTGSIFKITLPRLN